MQYELLIARRYLRAKRQVGLVTVISAIAVAGVAIGVAALICTLAVFNGFSSVVTSMLVGFDPHVRIEGDSGRTIHAEPMMRVLADMKPQVTGSAPVVSGRLMAMNHNAMRVVTARGVNNYIGDVGGVTRSIIKGAFDLATTDGLQGIVLGHVLADRLRVGLGDTITLVSPVGIEAAYTQFVQPLSQRFRVTGMYASMNKEYDGNFAYVSMGAAQHLFDRAPDEVDGIDIRCRDIGDAFAVKAALEKSIAANGEHARVLTWYDLHRDLYAVMEIERWVAYILLSLIIGVAAFTILGSLTMTVIEKQRDISLLKAVGASDRSIRRIFLYAGSAIGVIGSVAGAVLGFLVCLAQMKFQIFKLSSDFVIPAIPVELRVSDFVIICASAIILCTLAAVYPARRAARTVPAEELRWE